MDCEWIDMGNRERAAIMGAGLGGNYKSLRVKPREPSKIGGWVYSVNGADIGREPTRAKAMKAAERCATALIFEIA